MHRRRFDRFAQAVGSEVNSLPTATLAALLWIGEPARIEELHDLVRIVVPDLGDLDRFARGLNAFTEGAGVPVFRRVMLEGRSALAISMSARMTLSARGYRSRLRPPAAANEA